MVRTSREVSTRPPHEESQPAHDPRAGRLMDRKGDDPFITDRVTVRSYFQNTKHPELKFRALLIDGAQEVVRFERVAVG